MNPNELVESKWMVAEEFGLKGIPREPRVTIKDVRLQKVGAKENWGVLHFVEDWAKPLKINTTSKRALMLMFSETDTAGWIGKQIDLYAKPGNYPKGKKIAVRIKGSPDITKAISFSVQAFGGGEDIYNLVPTSKSGAAAPVDAYGRMWRLWKDAGFTDAAAFTALVRSSTGKAVKALVDADVPLFESALAAKQDGPPPADPEDLKSAAKPNGNGKPAAATQPSKPIAAEPTAEEKEAIAAAEMEQAKNEGLPS